MLLGFLTTALLSVLICVGAGVQVPPGTLEMELVLGTHTECWHLIICSAACHLFFNLGQHLS